jgi:tetratricopeptide (TPR) repeat protein
MALLQAIADMPEEAVRRNLAQLQSGEFLYEISLFPSVEYTFRHALTHEVAYSSLLQDRRRALHGRVVQAMEQLYADRLPEHFERLAHHTVRGEVWPKAVSYLRQAGTKAAMRSANREAVIFFEQAMNALTRLPEGRAATEQAIDLRLDLRSPLLQMGQLERVLTLSQEAEAMAEKLGDEQRLARVYTYLINYHNLKGEPDLAIEYGERCLRIGDAAGDAALQALARGYLGYSCHAQGQYRRAHSILRDNVEALELVQGDAPGGQAGVSYVTSSGWLAFTLAELGEFDAAAMSLDRAQRAGEASGHAYTQTIARTMAGLAWLRRGQLERALPALQRSLDACREKSLDVWRPIPSSLLGLTLVLLGRVDEGLRLLEDGVSLTEELGVRAYLALWTVHLGEGLAAARQLDRARTVAQRALDLSLRHKERGHQAWALRLLGEVAGLVEPPAVGEAEGYFGKALALAEELEMRPLQARAHLGLGRLLRLTGERDRAEDHLATALGLLREMDMRFWLSRAAEELLHLGHLFVVARHNIQLYDYLKREYAGEPVTVILDRRHGQRRERDEAPTSERRHAERRRQIQVDDAIRSRGFAVVPEIIGGA